MLWKWREGLLCFVPGTSMSVGTTSGLFTITSLGPCKKKADM